MDRHPFLPESTRRMRLILAVAVLGVACSGGKSGKAEAAAKYDPSKDSQAQTGFAEQLPPPPALGPDQSTSRVTGCSDSENPSEQDTVKFPPLVPGSRRPSATEVQLGQQAGGVWVSHNLTHACCTKAKVYVQRLPGQVSFFETMEGTPCGDGCTCSSKVYAAAGIPPGRYTVALRLEDSAGSSIVKQGDFSVAAY